MNVRNQTMLLKELLYLKEAVDCGSLSAVALRNDIKPSNLSVLIKNLEKNLGATLLIRKSTGVEVTEAGKQLYQIACVLEEKLDQLEKTTSKFCPQNLILSLPVGFVLPFLDDFIKENPTLTIRQREKVKNFDVGVFYELPTLSNEFQTKKITLRRESFYQDLFVVFRRQKASAQKLAKFIISRWLDG